MFRRENADYSRKDTAILLRFAANFNELMLQILCELQRSAVQVADSCLTLLLFLLSFYLVFLEHRGVWHTHGS